MTFTEKLRTAESWSIQYFGAVYDDARCIDGRWFVRDLAGSAYRPCTFDGAVVTLCSNLLTRPERLQPQAAGAA